MIQRLLRFGQKPPHAITSAPRIERQAEKSSADVVFINHRTSVFNLGDYLSTPRHYFKMTPRDPKRPITVIGGGVYDDYRKLKRDVPDVDLDGSIKVAWGIGVSRKDRTPGTEILRTLAKSFDFISTRDANFASEEVPFCPCASVLNAITDMPVGSGTAILLNFYPRASGPNPLAMLAEYENEYIVGSNAIGEADFRVLFGQASHIVTNSYHTAYWGLLSGRSVGIVGFSSKYDSISAMFDLDYRYESYQRGDGDGLKTAIASVLAAGRFVRLDDPAAYKARFRALNLDYARRLVDAGVFASIEPIADGDRPLSVRNREIYREFVLLEW